MEAFYLTIYAIDLHQPREYNRIVAAALCFIKSYHVPVHCYFCASCKTTHLYVDSCSIFIFIMVLMVSLRSTEFSYSLN